MAYGLQNMRRISARLSLPVTEIGVAIIVFEYSFKKLSFEINILSDIY